jgi:hypothetical protein
MGDLKIHPRVRRTMLLMVPAALASSWAPAQKPLTPPAEEPSDIRLPNGKRQQDEILKAEYEQNLKDAQELVNLAKAFELDLEKDDRFVLSLTSLKKLDEIEKLTRRIRTRMKR